MKHHPEFYLICVFVLLLVVWIIQRKRILSRLKHYGRHQIINVEGKPVSQLVEPSMMTMPMLTINYSKLKWVSLKILNEQIHYNIENEYKFIGQVFGGKVITHKARSNWITFYFENFKDEIFIKNKKRKPFEIAPGQDGLNKEVSFNIKDKSGIRLCGRPGSGKSFVLKTIYEQITSGEKFILTSKPQEFINYEPSQIYDATDLERLDQFSNKIKEVCQKVKNKSNPNPIYIFMDEAQQDLRETTDKNRNQIVQVIVDNVNYLLGVGRAYEIFLIIATQTDTLKETKLDVRQLPILITGKLHSDYTCDYYGIPKEIGFRDDLHKGKMVISDEGNWKIFKAYKPKSLGKK